MLAATISHSARRHRGQPAASRDTGHRRLRHHLLQFLWTALTLAASWYFVLPTQWGGQTTVVAVNGISMQPTFYTGDLVIARKASAYQVGEIIVYKVDLGNGQTGNIVHRIVGGNSTQGWITRGDNRTTTDQFHPRNDEVLGRVVIHVPGFWKYLKLAATPPVLGAFGGLWVLILLWPRRGEILPGKHRRKDQKDSEEPPDTGHLPKHAAGVPRVIELPDPDHPGHDSHPDRVITLPEPDRPARVVRLPDEPDRAPHGDSGH